MTSFVRGFADDEILEQEISDAHFVEVHAAREVFFAAVDFEERLAVLLANHYELEMELLGIAQSTIMGRPINERSGFDDRLALDRRFLNVLTAGRLYVDQADHGISSLFGDTSGDREAHLKFENNLYDTRWGYRLMSAIRNHIQHFSLLVDSIQYPHKATRAGDKSTARVQVSAVPLARVRSLSQNKKFKPAILDELRARGEESIDLRLPIREYVSCLVELHRFCRDLLKTKADAARALYEQAIVSHSVIDGTAVRVPSLICETEGRMPSEVYLSADLLRYYNDLTRKNEIHFDLTRNTASTSDQDAFL